MTWQPYGFGFLALLAVLLAAGTAWLLGWSPEMLRGVLAGGGLGLLLFVFGVYSLRKGLKEEKRSAALGHALGGFGLRLFGLLVGVVVSVYTGWANAAGFAVSFLAITVMYLAFQATVVSKSLRRPAQGGAA